MHNIPNYQNLILQSPIDLSLSLLEIVG